MPTTATSLLVALALSATSGVSSNQARTATPGAVSLTGVTAAEGTSLSLSRADHTHSITGTLASGNGGVPAGGTSATFLRGDLVWAAPRFDQLANPTGDASLSFPSGTKALWTFTGSTDNAFSIHGDGAFTGTGDLVHINKTGTGSTAGADALHVEVTSDTNMVGVRATMPGATNTGFSTNGKIVAPTVEATTASVLLKGVGSGTEVGATVDTTAAGGTSNYILSLKAANSQVASVNGIGGFTSSVPSGQYGFMLSQTGARLDLGLGTTDYLYSLGGTLGIRTPGLITADAGFVGALTGNASTATALAADGTDCSAGQAPLGVDASGNATGCFTPSTRWDQIANPTADQFMTLIAHKTTFSASAPASGAMTFNYLWPAVWPTAGGTGILMQANPTATSVGSVLKLDMTGGANSSGFWPLVVTGAASGQAAIFNGITDVAGRLDVTPYAASPTLAGVMRLGSGLDPTTPTNGDLWYTGSALNFRTGGVTRDLLGASGSAGTGNEVQTGDGGGGFLADSTFTYDPSTVGGGTLYVPFIQAEQVSYTGAMSISATGNLNLTASSMNVLQATTGTSITSPYTWINGQLQLKQSTATRSSLQFLSAGSVNPTTPVSGDMWWTGTALNFFDGSTTRNLLAAGGGGSPGGSAGSVQFNDGAGGFAGDAGFTYSYTASVPEAALTHADNNLHLKADASGTSITSTSTVNGLLTLASPDGFQFTGGQSFFSDTVNSTKLALKGTNTPGGGSTSTAANISRYPDTASVPGAAGDGVRIGFSSFDDAVNRFTTGELISAVSSAATAAPRGTMELKAFDGAGSTSLRLDGDGSLGLYNGTSLLKDLANQLVIGHANADYGTAGVNTAGDLWGGFLSSGTLGVVGDGVRLRLRNNDGTGASNVTGAIDSRITSLAGAVPASNLILRASSGTAQADSASAPGLTIGGDGTLTFYDGSTTTDLLAAGGGGLTKPQIMRVTNTAFGGF